MMPPDSHPLDAMIEAVERAAVATRHVHRMLTGTSLLKEDRSPVTVADWASQAVAATVLSRQPATSGLPLVGEEDSEALRGNGGSALRASVALAASHALGAIAESECIDAIDRGRADPSDRFLTIDPVDGTKGFLRGQQYAISLALVERGVVTAGVVGCPHLPPEDSDDQGFASADHEGCLAFATRGGGAFLRHRGRDRRLSIASWRPGDPVRSCESVESSHSRQDLAAELLGRLGSVTKPARLDSQAKYVVVGRGGAEVYLRLPTAAAYVEKIWDHAAGALVAAEAGALVSDVEGRPLDFGHGRELVRNRGVIAGHPDVVRRLIELHARGVA